MAFSNIAVLYLPVAANAGTSQWGTDVKKMLNAADTTADATTVTNHGTGGAVTRTEDPYTTTATDGVEANFGWAITPTDMNSVAGARRFYPPGNHAATVRMASNTTVGVTGTISMYVYRVGNAAGGRVRTLLGSNTAAVMLPGTSGEVTMTCTVALSEVIFEADETVQYSFEFNLAGLAITGRTATFFTGTQTSVQSRVNTPTLGVLADTTGAATGTGTATGVTGMVLGTEGNAVGSGVAAGVGASRADTTGTATGTGTVTGLGSSVAGTVGTATGLGTASGLASIVLSGVGTVTIGAATSATPDWPVTTPTKSVAGIVLHHETGATVTGATVRLYRVSDDLMVQTVTSGAAGAYSFTRDDADPYTYYVAAQYVDAGVQVHGVSDRGLTPS